VILNHTRLRGARLTLGLGTTAPIGGKDPEPHKK
jgi:hypothetical protein